jgi:ABC-type thiamin/hydroxymethylpyrimidine transport system permease subunit
VNAPRIADQIFGYLNLTSLFALFVFLLCRLTSGAFTIESLTPTLRRNLNEHPILICKTLD